MTVNTIPAQALARQPRGIVKLGGQAVSGWVSWEVSSNNYYEADTFRVSFAASALPVANNAAWFATQKELFVEIFAGFPANPERINSTDLQSLIYGRVDDISFDPVSTLITVTGRDLTAAFIDAKLTAAWTNQTSSSIAIALASSHGLTPVVTATKTNVGTYYKHDQVRMQSNRSEWDLLAWIAREEGFVCYVTGNELHFEPDTVLSADPYVIRWTAPSAPTGYPTANVQELHFSRSLTVAKGITVTVRSPSTTKKTPVVQSYPAAAKVVKVGKSAPFGNSQAYFFTIASNKTANDVQAYAQARYKEIIAHEMKLHARLPGDNLLSTRTLLRVDGTGTAFDQTYFPNVITRQMSMDEGYTMTVEAKNHNPDTVAAP